MAHYEEQYCRMVRWFEKIEEIAEPGEENIDPVEFRDFFITYFQTCYHLKDYLEKDSSTRITESDVSSFIDTNQCMRLCADLCNATKHLHLDSSGRSGEFPGLGGGAYVTENPSEGVSAATYLIEMDSGEKDAYEIARDCKDAWDGFLQSNNLSVPTCR